MLLPKVSILVFAAGASATILRLPHHDHRVVVARRSTPSNAADLAQVKSARQQCTSYEDQGVEQMKQQNEFPAPDQIASILDNDQEARALYNEIKGGIPNIDVRQASSDHTSFGTNNYPSSDPDCWWSWTGCHKPKHPNILPDITQCKEQSTWGLTFDDGPYCSHNKLYNFLQSEKVRATLFYIGSNVLNNPYQAQRGLVDGHDICHHTWSHRLMTTLSNEQVFAELYYAGKVIKKVIGVTPLCWRPPQGDVDDRVRYIASALGMRTILWKEDTNDWNIQPDGSDSVSKIDENYRKIINKAGSESPVVLTHELSSHTMNEFMKMYPEIKKAYQHVSPLSACLNVRHPYKENITYPNFSEYTSGNLNYQSLPTGTQIKTKPSAHYKPVPISQESHGFHHNSS
ncbi:hypothetical protein CBS9595_003209 [Malassezia furfur]|nr:hypothetical protein CBS9595_003209 [Malassezia furfur]